MSAPAHFHKEMAFSEAEYAQRLARVRTAMDAARLDVLLVHSMPNICYLTGYQTPLSDWYQCLIVPRNGDVTLQVCDPELAQMNAQVANIVTVRWDRMDDAADQLVELLRGMGADGKRIGLELRRPGLNAFTAQTLHKGLAKAAFEDASPLVLDLRATKSPAEIECMRIAARFTSIGMAAGIAAIRAGATENDVGAAANAAMLAAGSEFFSIEPIVRAGWRSSVVHATCKRSFLKPGDPVFMEFGGVYQRYCAPLLRTAVIGKPSAPVRRLADAALRALDLLYANVRPGRVVDEVGRAAAKGYEGIGPEVRTREYHAYSVGISFPPVWVEHSIGIAEGSNAVLQPGMTFHTPRSLRIPGAFATGFSETILVTETGCEILTDHPRELAIV